MSSITSLASLVVLGLTFWFAVVFAEVSRAEFLEPGKTAPAPEFQGVTQWVNSEPLTMAKLRGKVVLVHFWTNGCYNCVNNYPHYKAWQEQYAGKDVVIGGIHTPETPSEHDVGRIKDRRPSTG